MDLKLMAKTAWAVAYNNRAKIETAVGMGLVIFGTAKVISKAREACELADELDMRNRHIHLKDANGDWESKKERSKEVRGVVKYAVVEYGKIYGPWVGAELAGLGLILLSDVTQNNEIATLTAAVSTYATTLNTVKERVIADQGEEKWQEYLLGPQVKTVEVQEDGTVIEKTEPLANPNAGVNLPPHCYIWDEWNAPSMWTKDPVKNRTLLEDHLRWLNLRLHKSEKGYLLKNEVLDDFGLERTKDGWTAGIFAKDKDGNDNYLDIGLEAKNPQAQAFRDGIEPSIILQFNFEDNIIDRLNLQLT